LSGPHFQASGCAGGIWLRNINNASFLILPSAILLFLCDLDPYNKASVGYSLWPATMFPVFSSVIHTSGCDVPWGLHGLSLLDYGESFGLERTQETRQNWTADQLEISCKSGDGDRRRAWLAIICMLVIIGARMEWGLRLNADGYGQRESTAILTRCNLLNGGCPQTHSKGEYDSTG